MSERFLETLRGSHKVVTRARVCSTFQTGTDPDGVEISKITGDVRSVSSALVRSTLNISTAELWPEHVDDPITPYGNEIFVERGIDYGNGNTEFVGLGYYRIDTPEQDEVPDGVITLNSAPDRMQGIIDAQFLAPRQFLSSISRGDLVTTLITEVYPAAVISWDDAAVRDAAIGRAIIVEQDRAQTLVDLVTSLGKIGYWRYDGVFRIETPPDIDGEPSWIIDAGESGVMVKMSRNLTRAGVKNAWVVTGEAGDTTPPARGVALNMDPESPTYYLGRFGPIPGFFSSPFVTTNLQAQAAATTLLRKEIGLPYQVNLGSIVNPALEPYDVVEVRYPRTGRNRSLRSEIHVIDDSSIPLTVEQAMGLSTRERRQELIGIEGT